MLLDGQQQEQLKFQVMISGVPYGTPQPSRQLAELLLSNLTPDQRVLAEVASVTSQGQQLLFE